MFFVASSLLSHDTSHIQALLKGSQKGVNLDPLTLPLLGKMMQISRAWRDIIANDLIWQGIGDSWGVIFSLHMRNPTRVKYENYGGSSTLLSERMMLLHEKIYPHASRKVVDDYFREHITLPQPSKKEQIKDFYAQITFIAYQWMLTLSKFQEETSQLLGSFESEHVLKLIKINEARGCLKLLMRLNPERVMTSSMEALLSVPEDLINWCKSHDSSQIDELEFQDRGLFILPDIFEDLPNLDSLELKSNHLTQLPDSIGKLQKLIYLSLIGNQLTTLPDSMKSLTNLITLNLASNDLSALPDWIGDLKNLGELRVDHNHLTCLPDTIGNLTLLIELHLDGNKLVEVPISIGKLKNLNILNLEANDLKSLPDSVGNLVNLTSLELDGNMDLKSTELPKGIWSLRKLSNLTVPDDYSTYFWDHKIRLKK